MQVVYERCCGLDIHKRSISACLLLPGPGRTRHQEVRTFGTTSAELLTLRTWLVAMGCTHVAMESTGPYWRPIFNLLEGTVTLVLANPSHIKAVPGRKTDVGDAEWIAELLRHGLIRPSFVPPKSLRELRELTRYRKALIQERTAEVNRVQKVLEGANIKLASVVTDIMGMSSRAMLDALVDGSTDVQAMAELARGRMRKKRAELEQALVGAMGDHQRFVVRHQLAHIDFLGATIDQCSAEIAERLDPVAVQRERLCTIPGVGQRTAEVILAELGWDMQQFPSAKHLASWAGLCPGNHESAGKRKSGRTRQGSKWLREALVEAAQAAARTRSTYLAAQYRRLAARRGANKALVAVAHSILVIVYHLLKHETVYEDLGHTYFDQRDRDHVSRRLVSRLAALGYTVTVEAPRSADDTTT